MKSVFFKKHRQLIRASIVLAFGFASQAHGNQIAVKPAVELELSKAEITLSDVVVANGLSRTAIEKFRTIRIADAPKAGESRTFTQDVIAASIKDDLKSVEVQTGEHFELKIPSRVTVTKKKASFSSANLKAQLLSKFKEICGECDFEINNLNVPATAKMAPDATWALRVPKELPKGSFSYPIEITLNDVTSQAYWVSGQLVIRRLVPVAAREIAVGEKIQPDDLVSQMKDVTFAIDAPVSPADLASGVSSRQISAGQIVFRSSVRKELAVRMGDVVKVTTGTDEWQISLDGISQASGSIGDVIKVKIPKTQKLVSGLLREKGVVEVQ